MLRSIGLPELLVLVVVGVVLLFIPTVLYLRMLQRVLAHCAPESRTMEPAKVWLLFIPLFNLVWQFVVVGNIATSLRNEFARRNFASYDREPGKKVGMAMAILSAVGIIPVVGQVAGIIGCVCWVIYWRKISGYDKLLSAPVTVE